MTVLLVATGPLLVLSGCASTRGPRLGTGDVSFRLLWEGRSDLDLHVSDPSGAHISHQHRHSATGGILDIDCNADRVCSQPVENVYWPLGLAPHGQYRVWVRAHHLVEHETPVPARLLILRGDAVATEHRGTLTGDAALIGPFEFFFGDSPAISADASSRMTLLSGTWDCTTKLSHGESKQVLMFESDLSGTLLLTEPTFTISPISDARVVDEILRFVVALEELGPAFTLEFQGSIDGDVIAGAYVGQSMPKIPTRCARRAPLGAS